MLYRCDIAHDEGVGAAAPPAMGTHSRGRGVCSDNMNTARDSRRGICHIFAVTKRRRVAIKVDSHMHTVFFDRESNGAISSINQVFSQFLDTCTTKETQLPKKRVLQFCHSSGAQTWPVRSLDLIIVTIPFFLP